MARPLLLLVALAPACYLNPGFKLDDDDGGSTPDTLATDTDPTTEPPTTLPSDTTTTTTAPDPGTATDDPTTASGPGDPTTGTETTTDTAPCDNADCGGEADWLVRSGDLLAQFGADAAVLGDGSVVVVGAFTGELGEGPHVIDAGIEAGDGFVGRFGPDGELLWLRQIGGAGLQLARSVVALTDGRIGVAGDFNGGFEFPAGDVSSAAEIGGFVGVFGPDGEGQWARAFGSGSVLVADLAAAPAGGLDVAGGFEGEIKFDKTHQSIDIDPFLAHYDAGGAPVWSSVPANPGPQAGKAVATGAGGEVVLVGDFAGAFKVGEGDALIAAGSDVFAVRYTPAGAPMWSAGWGSPGIDQALAVAVGPGQEFALLGVHRGDIAFGDEVLPGPADRANMFLALLEPDGSPRWVRDDLDLAESAAGVAIGGDGSVVALVAGAGPVDFGHGPVGEGDGCFLVRFAAHGGLRWGRQLRGEAVVLYGTGLGLGPDGHVGVAGAFPASLATAGVDPLQSAGGSDLFVGRFQP